MEGVRARARYLVCVYHIFPARATFLDEYI